MEKIVSCVFPAEISASRLPLMIVSLAPVLAISPVMLTEEVSLSSVALSVKESEPNLQSAITSIAA